MHGIHGIPASQDVDMPRSKYLMRRAPTPSDSQSSETGELSQHHHGNGKTGKSSASEFELTGGRVHRATSYADRRLPAAPSEAQGGPCASSKAPAPAEEADSTFPMRRQPYLQRRRQVDFRWVEFDGAADAAHVDPASSRALGVRVSIHGRGSHAVRTAEGMMAIARLDAAHVSSPPPHPRKEASVENQEPVLLNIYDLGDSKAIQRLNVILKPMGSGAYHAAVQVYGQEWSFGGLGVDDPIEEGFETGIWSCRPQGCRQHSYRESIQMGHTSYSHAQVLEIIRDMMEDWPMNSYQILRRNCCHFCDALCQLIGVGPLPAWILNLAGVGASLESVQSSTFHATVSVVSAVRDLTLRVKKRPSTLLSPHTLVLLVTLFWRCLAGVVTAWSEPE